MDFAKNLKRLRENKNLTQECLAEELGISKSTISMYENGNREPDFEMQEAIADFFNVSLDYLMGRKSYRSYSDFLSVPNIEPMPQLKKVPLLGTIACGEPILAEENIEGYVDVPSYVKCDFTLKCKGDSMVNARIYDGDIVCVKQQPIVENGEIAAVLIDGEATLKRFYRYGDLVVLRAENQNFKDLEYKKDQLNDICIIGRATHFISLVK